MPPFSITWFRRTNSSGAEELSGSLQRVSISVAVTSAAGGAALFTRRTSRFTLLDLDQMNDVGEYWCQVRLENNGTVLQEKSNILILYNEACYQGLRRCNGSGFVEQIDCLHTLQIIQSFITDDKPTNSEPTFSFNLFPTLITNGAIEKPEKSNKDLFVVIAIVVFFFHSHCTVDDCYISTPTTQKENQKSEKLTEIS